MSADVFEVYGGPVQSSNEGATKDYRAALPFLADERTLMLRVHYSNGKIELLPYGLLLSVLSDSPGHLALLFSSGVVECLGENLRDLLDDIQAHSVKLLQPFDGARFVGPEAGAPVIDTIEFKNAGDFTG